MGNSGFPWAHDTPGQQTVSDSGWPLYLGETSPLLSQQMGGLPWGLCFVSMYTHTHTPALLRNKIATADEVGSPTLKEK